MAENPQPPYLDRMELERQLGGYEPPSTSSSLPNIPFKGLETPMPSSSRDAAIPASSVDSLENSIFSIRPDGRKTGGGIPRSLNEITNPRYNSYVPGDYDNEDAYAQGQGWTEKMINGVGKGLVLTGTTFLQSTVGLVNGLASWANDGKFSSFYNNDFNKRLDDINKELDTNLLPNYETNIEKDAKWYSPDYLFTANFLWNGIVKNMGFAAGAALSGGVYAAGIKGLSSLPRISRLVSIGKQAEVLAATEQGLLATDKVANTYGKIKSLSDRFLTSYNVLSPGGRAVVAGLSTTGEAGFEAYQVLNEFRESKIREFKEKNNGVLPGGADLEKINRDAEAAGNAAFLANVGLLTATNYIQFPKILGSSYTAEKGMINSLARETRDIVEEAGKYIAKPSRGGKILGTLNKIRPYTFSASEAFEEGAQFAVSKGVEDYYNKKYNNDATDFLKSLSVGITETLGTDEGMKNVLIGGLSGALMQAKGKFAENREKTKNTADAIQQFNKFRLSDFMKDTIDSVNRGTVLQQEREELLKKGDVLNSKDKEMDYTINYLSPRIKYGRYDLVSAEITDYRMLASSDEGFSQLVAEGKALPTDTRQAYLDRLTKLEQTANNVKSLYQSLNLRYGGMMDEKGRPLYTSDVMDKMVYAASKVADYDVRIPALTPKVLKAGVNVDQVVKDIVEGKVDSFNEAIDAIKNITTLTEDDKIDMAEALEDVAEMSIRRDAFLKEYDKIKNSPKKYQEKITPTPEEQAPSAVPSEEEKVKIKTATGEKEYEVGQKYFVGKGVDYAKEELDAPVKVSSLTILGENEDGTLKIRDNKGEERDISKDVLQDYKLSKESTLLSNKTARYFYNHRNEVFVYNFGKAFGGEKPGRLEYDNGKLFFVYLDGKGKIKRKQVDNSHFVAQEGYKNARIKRVGVIETTEQKEAREEFTSAEELAKQKETLAKSKDKRIQIITELETETRTRLEEVNKKLDTKKKELEGIQEELDEISKDVSVASARTKREKKLEEKYPELSRQKVRFNRVFSTTSKALTKLSRMREDVENEISTLNAEKDELEFNLSYIEDFGQNLDELPENSGEFLKELKDQVQWIDMLIKETGKNINALADMGNTIEKSIKEFISLLEKSLKKLDTDYPAYIKNSIEKFKQNPSYSEGPMFRKALEDYLFLKDVEKEISVNEKELSDINDELSLLYKQLDELGSQYQAKKTILDRFQAISDAYEAMVAEEDRIMKNEKLKAELLGTQERDVQTVDFDEDNKGSEKSYEAFDTKYAFEPYSKKPDELLPNATLGIMAGKDHQVRANTFGFNLDRFENRNEIRGVYVTSKNEKELIPGLTEFLRLDEQGQINEDVKPDNIIALVMVQEIDGELKLLGVDGKPIPEDADKLENAIFQVFPDGDLKWGAKYNNESMFRNPNAGERKELIESVTKQYKEKREGILKEETIGEPHKVAASFGFIDTVKDEDGNTDYSIRTAAEDANLIDEGDLETSPLIKIPTLPSAGSTLAVESKGTSTISVPVGTPLLELPNGLVKLQNRRHTEEEAETIYQAILQLAKNMIDPEIGINHIKSVRLLTWLRSIVYWGIPETQDGKRKPAGYNSIFFEKDEETGKLMLTLSGKGKDFRFTPSSLEMNKETILFMLENMYNNINNKMAKDINESYEEILSISDDGEITSRTWKNYQSYLLSSKTPDGKKRSGNQIPLSTLLKPATSKDEVNRKNIYFYTTDTIDDISIPVVEKKASSKIKMLRPGAPTPIKEAPSAAKPTGLQVGRYVSYKDTDYIITKVGDDGKIEIYSPVEKNRFSGISPANVQPKKTSGTVVEYKGKEYIVTKSKIIISTSEGKVVDWKEDSEDRKNVLSLVEESEEVVSISEEGPVSEEEEVFSFSEEGVVPKPKTAVTKEKYVLDGKSKNVYISPGGKRIGFVAPSDINAENFTEKIKVIKGEDEDEVIATLKAAGKDAKLEILSAIFKSIPSSLLTEEKEEVFSFSEEQQKEVVSDAESKLGKPISKEVTNAVNRAVSNKLKGKRKALRAVINREIEAFKPENWNKVEAWLKANFPNIPVYRVKNIIQATNGKQAWGMFKDGAIYIYENAEVGTAYHEVFHAVWRMMTDSKEQKSILNEMRGRSGKFFDRTSLSDISYAEATEEQLEEKLAEEFRDYVQFKKIPAKPAKGRPFVLKLFSDLVNIIKEFFFGPQSKVEEMFNKIGRGYYKSYVPFETSLSFAKAGVINIEDAFADESAALSVITGLTDRQTNDVIQEMLYQTLLTFTSTDRSLFEIPNVNKKDLYNKLKDGVLEVVGMKIVEAKELVKDKIHTEQEVEPLISSTLQLMENINTQWEKIVEKHQEYLKGYSIEFDENDEAVLRDENNSGRETYADATKIDNFKKASAAIKLLLSTIPIADAEGNIIPSSIGGATLLPTGRVYISLMNKLHTSATIDEMLERLHKMAKEDPNYKTLYERVSKRSFSDKGVDLTKIDTEHGLQLLSSMWRTFKKQSPKVKNVFILDNGDVVVGEANLSTAAQQIKREYINSIIYKTKEGKGYFKYDGYKNKFVGDPSKVRGVDLSTTEETLKFLSNLGIVFTKSDVSRMSNDQKEVFNEAAKGIRESAANVEEIATFSGKVLNIDNRLLQLALVRAALDSPEFSSTYFNISGERTQTYIGTNAVSDLAEFFSKTKVFNKNTVGDSRYSYLLTDSFAKNSNLLSRMYASNGKKKDGAEDLFEVGIVGGTSNRPKGKDKESSNLTYKERLVQEINLNLEGWYLNLVPGDASIEWMIKMGNPISLKSLSKGMTDINNIFKGYFLSEVELVRENRPVAKNRDAKELRFFKGILGDTLHGKVMKAAQSESKTPEDIYNQFSKEINAKIEEYIKDDIKKTKAALLQYGIMQFGDKGIVFENVDIPSNLKETEVDNHLTVLSVNYMIANIEMHKIIYSDPYQYEDELKRIKSFNSPRQAIISGSSKMNAALDRVWNKEYETGDIGHTNFIRDYFRSATHKDTIGVIDLPGYDAFKETDGGGIISMKALRNFRLRAGDWNSDEERQYKYDVAWEKRDRSKGLNDEQIKKAGLKLSKKEMELLAAGNPSIKSTYTPIKPIVSGSKLGKNGRPASYNNIVLDKFALYPLSYRIMKELDENSNALKLYEKMQKEDIDYIVFDSGRKVGAEKSHDTYDENGNFNNTPYKAVVNIPFSIMSIQAEVPSKGDNLVTRGSQVTKLITLDFLQAGVPIDFSAYDANGNEIPFEKRFVEWSNMTDEQKSAYNNGNNIYNEIKNNKDLLNALTKIGYENTLKRLGIKENISVGKDGVVKRTFEIVDRSKVVTTLREEILKREVNDNISSALNGFLNGKVLLEATPAYQQVKNILYSIADKEFLSPKISGGMKVQIPSTFFESGTRKVKDGLYESDVLNFYEKDGKRVAEVMLGRWFDSPLSDKELIKYLNETEEGQKILAGVAFRIPTQKQNSIDAIVIKKFLPKEFADSVVVPAALVQKVGSDFDIDKLSVYLKNVYIKDGKPQLVQFLTDENSTVEERYVHWVKENSERDTRKYIKFLTRSQVQNLKVNFEIELAKLKAKYQVISVERKEDLFQQMSDDIQSNISKELSPQEEYMDELFNLGKKVFWRMDDITREPFWQVKNDISRKGIKGPDEIRRYLSLTVGMLQDPNTLEDDIVRLEGLEKIYTEELRIMGIMNETVEQVKKDAIAEFRKNKEALKNTLKLEKATEFDSVDNAYEEAKTELGFQSAQEIANIDGLLSIEEFRQLSIFNQNIKKALENAYIQSMENFITHPLNYDNLIKPNSAELLKDLAEEIALKTVGSTFDYKRVNNMLDRTFMSRLRHAFVRGKYAIGIAAVNQTNHSLSQRQPIYIDRERLSLVSEEDRFWLDDAIIKFKDYNRIVINNKTYPTLSFIKDANAYEKERQMISDIIGMFIDGYVDISKGPWIMELGATPNVASTWLFLVKIGVPIKSVAYFMNQPIVRDYLASIENAGYSWLFIDTFVENVSEKYGGELSKEEMKTRSDRFVIPNEKVLNANLGKSPEDMNTEEKIQQQLILKEFLKYAKMAEHMFLVTQGSNYDTSNFNDPYLVFKKEMQYEQAKNTIISSVDKLLDNSFIGEQKVRVTGIRDAFAEVLTSDKKNIRTVMHNVLKPFINMPNREFVKVAQKAVSDLFDWAVQTDQKLNDYIKDILINDGGVGKEVMAFVNSVKAKGEEHELYGNIIIDIIESIPSKKAREGGVNNVELKMKDNKVYDQNNVIYAFRELRDYLKGENDPLYERIKTLAVLQSGLSASQYSFTSLLPYEDFEDIYNKTLIKLESMNLNTFYELGVFQRNNWNNDDIVPYLVAKTIKSKKSGDLYYNPGMQFLPNTVKKAVAEKRIPPVVSISKRNREGNSDYIVFTWMKEDREILTKEDIRAGISANDKRNMMKKAGDMSYMNKALFRKVYDEASKTPYEHLDYQGTPYFVYKAINAWGDGVRANEFWETDHKSVIDNDFMKVEDVSDAVITTTFLEDKKGNKQKSAPTAPSPTAAAPVTPTGKPVTSKVATPKIPVSDIDLSQNFNTILHQLGLRELTVRDFFKARFDSLSKEASFRNRIVWTLENLHYLSRYNLPDVFGRFLNKEDLEKLEKLKPASDEFHKLDMYKGKYDIDDFKKYVELKQKLQNGIIEIFTPYLKQFGENVKFEYKILSDVNLTALKETKPTAAPEVLSKEEQDIANTNGFKEYYLTAPEWMGLKEAIEYYKKCM